MIFKHELCLETLGFAELFFCRAPLSFCESHTRVLYLIVMRPAPHYMDLRLHIGVNLDNKSPPPKMFLQTLRLIKMDQLLNCKSSQNRLHFIIIINTVVFFFLKMIICIFFQREQIRGPGVCECSAL